MTWLPGWEVVRGNNSGTWANTRRAPKLLLHTTEGSTVEGAVGAYRANNSWPHVTVDPVRKRRVQHLPLDVPARALRNSKVPGETNRSPITIQVEIVGQAKNTPGWDDEADWLGSDVVAPLCAAAGIPIESTVEFYGLDAGFTLARADARQRLSRAAWESYSGILGHQHAPENTHWDPGGIDIDRVIFAATRTAPTPPAQKDDFLMALNDEQQKRVLDLLEAQDLRLQAVDQRLARLEAANNTDGNDQGKPPYLPRTIQSLARVEADLATVKGSVQDLAVAVTAKT